MEWLQCHVPGDTQSQPIRDSFMVIQTVLETYVMKAK